MCWFEPDLFVVSHVDTAGAMSALEVAVHCHF